MSSTGFLDGENARAWIPVGCLVLALIAHGLHRSRIAATVFLFIVSATVAWMGELCFCDHDHIPNAHFHESFHRLLGSTPHFVEMVFVPPIIFETAFSLDFYDFYKFKWQVLILIVPCFVASTLLLGSIILLYSLVTFPAKNMRLLKYENIFTLSGYLTAIDPIMVSGILEDLGLSHQLTTLLKFESLLCQAAAEINDELIHWSIREQTLQPAIFQLLSIFGSLVIGWVYGRALVSLLSNVLYVDHVAESGMIFVMVYVSYATGTLMHSSGILCLVVFAITFNSCRSSISQRTIDDMKIWSTLSFSAHGALVGLVGMSAGRLVAHMTSSEITARLLESATFPFALFVRFAILLIFTPVLRYAGGFELEFLAMMVATGLRGFLPIIMTNEKMHENRQLSHDHMHRILDWFLWQMIVVVVFGQIFQGPFLKLLADRLGLRLQSHVQADFYRDLAKRVNQHMRRKQEKLQKEDSSVAWDLIEKKIVFNFVPEDQSKPNMDSESSSHEDVRSEIEARERVHLCYEAQIRKIWQSYGRSMSVATRVLENTINDAAMNSGPLNIQNLFDQVQPRPFIRRLAAAGRKCMKRMRLKKLLDRFSVYETFWRWRLFICVATMTISSYIIHMAQSVEQPEDVPSVNMYIVFLVSLAMTIDQIIRYFRMIGRFRKSSSCKLIFKEVWFWFETYLLVAQLLGDYVHFRIMMGTCVDEEGGYIDLTDKINQECAKWRVIMTVADCLPLLQLPLVIGLIFRLLLSEIQVYVQARDEETFEAISSLLTVTDTVIRMLSGRTVVKTPELRKKLMGECNATKSALEEKLIELLNRQGGAMTLANIKTRQAAREMIEEVAVSLLDGKHCGSLRDIEYFFMEDIVNKMRANVQTMEALDEQQSLAEEEDLDKSATNDAAMDILASQLKEMEWMRAVTNQAEVNEIINMLIKGGRLENFKMRDKIVVDGETAKKAGFYILLNGFCRGITFDYVMEESKRRLIYAGTIFGENGLLGEAHTETVVAASPKVLTYWISARSISKLPAAVAEAFDKHLVSKACMEYMRSEERFCAWQDEMIYSCVRSTLMVVKARDIVPEKHSSLILFKGKLEDDDKTTFSAIPSRPIKMGVNLDRQFKAPLVVKSDRAFYQVNRPELSLSQTSHTGAGDTMPDIVSDSFLLAALDSEESGSGSNTCASTYGYKKFKPLYTKLKKKKDA